MTKLKQITNSNEFYQWKEIGAHGISQLKLYQPIWLMLDYPDEDEQLYMYTLTENWTHKILTDLMSEDIKIYMME